MTYAELTMPRNKGYAQMKASNNGAYSPSSSAVDVTPSMKRGRPPAPPPRYTSPPTAAAMMHEDAAAEEREVEMPLVSE